MAFVTEFNCTECEQPRFEVVVPPRICAKCRTRIEAAKKLVFVQSCEARPLESRVKRLEEWFYDLDAERRLKALEAKNATY